MAKDDKDKPQLDVPSTAAVDLKNRLENDFRTDTSVEGGPLDEDGKLRSEVNAPFAVEDNDTSAYVGVSPEYMTYADETHKPFKFEGDEGESVKRMLEDQFAVGQDKPVETERTLGTGSNAESVYTATSGEDLTPEVMDRVKVLKEAEQKNEDKTSEAAPESQPTPAKKTAAASRPSS